MAKRKVPDLFVEQLLLEEASARRTAVVEAELGPEGIARRLAELRRSDEEVLRRYPPEQMASRIRARLGTASPAADLSGVPRLGVMRGHSRGSRRVLRISLPLAAAAAIALSLAFIPNLLQSGRGAEAVRVKGEPQLLVYREGAGGPELLRDRATVKEGDVLQIKYVPSGRPYGAILSVDGRGTVTLHFPDSAGASTRLEQDKAAALDFGYRLDDAPGYERFFFVTSGRSFPASVIVDSARRLAASGARSGALELPEGFEQTSELFVKGE